MINIKVIIIKVNSSSKNFLKYKSISDQRARATEVRKSTDPDQGGADPGRGREAGRGEVGAGTESTGEDLGADQKTGEAGLRCHN